jgi:hypothetical protein
LLVGAPAAQAAQIAAPYVLHVQVYDDDAADDYGRPYGDRFYGDRGYGERHYDRPPPYRHRIRISCEHGARIVDNQGFYRVWAIDCEAPVYTYRASRNGRPFIVQLNARSGGIISVRRVWRQY